MQSDVSYRKLNRNECVYNIEGLRILLVFCKSESKVNLLFCSIEGSNLEKTLLLLFCGHDIKCLGS